MPKYHGTGDTKRTDIHKSKSQTQKEYETAEVMILLGGKKEASPSQTLTRE